jgi:hypothetical protein
MSIEVKHSVRGNSTSSATGSMKDLLRNHSSGPSCTPTLPIAFVVLAPKTLSEMPDGQLGSGSFSTNVFIHRASNTSSRLGYIQDVLSLRRSMRCEVCEGRRTVLALGDHDQFTKSAR